MPKLNPPAPFVVLPFDKRQVDRLTMSEGHLYSKEEQAFHPEIKVHHAVDFKAPQGTPVYAAANGVVMTSYHVHYILSPDGKPMGFGLGLCVYQLCANDYYIIYAHLDEYNTQLMDYVEPVEDGNGNWNPRGLFMPLHQFRRRGRPIRKGELIGNVGYTGLLVGDVLEKPRKIPRLSPKRHLTWDPAGAHLHWEICKRTADGSAKDPDSRLDPFGIYGERQAYNRVFTWASGVILADSSGAPQFAR